MIRLARICSDGCILQRQRRVRLWGWCNENASIRAALTDAGKLIAEAEAEVTAEVTGVQEMPEAEGEPGDAAGRFDLYFPAMEAGGPYELTVTASSSASESAGSRASQSAGSSASQRAGDSASQRAESLTVHDIYIGEVIHLAGQSNIEFPMARVRDTYPEEFENPDDPLIRTFKVQPKLVFTDPLTDAETGEWTAVTKASLPDYSALGYFLAKKIRSADGVPVGLVNTSLGGSFVESWMSREMLAQWPELIARLDGCRSETFVEDNFNEGMRIAQEWDALLNERDEGCKCPGKWDTIVLPAMFSAIPQLKGFIGCVWLKKKFTVPAEIAGKACTLWLGTMTDADETYVNGRKVGETVYKYPPRRYPIPEGLLREGENEVTIRLKIEKGHGRVTPGKLLAVFEGQGRRTTDGFNEGIEGVNWLADLSGKWKMKKGCAMPEKGGVDFIIQKPAGQFNGMLAPVWEYTSGEVVWYQGESDSDRAHLYMDKFRTLVETWRHEIGDHELPFYVVVLPEYDEMNYEKDEDPRTEEDWWKMQEVQRQTVDIPYVIPVEITGSGELNDLHPQRKKIVGENVAKAILANK